MDKCLLPGTFPFRPAPLWDWGGQQWLVAHRERQGRKTSVCLRPHPRSPVGDVRRAARAPGRVWFTLAPIAFQSSETKIVWTPFPPVQEQQLCLKGALWTLIPVTRYLSQSKRFSWVYTGESSELYYKNHNFTWSHTALWDRHLEAYFWNKKDGPMMIMRNENSS